MNLADYEAAAKDRLPHAAWEYFSSGVGDEVTLAENEAAFRRLRLRARVLVDVSQEQLDTHVDLFGRNHEFPVLLAPCGYHKLAHPDGEREVVRGADAAGAVVVASAYSTTTFEDMTAVSSRPLWFQLYVHPDREITRELVQRVEAAGCAGIMLTADLPVLGTRNREARAGFRLPAGVERANFHTLGSAVAGASHRPVGREIYSSMKDPGLTWADFEWLKSITKLPVLPKGIMTGDDAEIAIQSGADGVVVSNHGARSLDTLPATIDVLPEVADAVGRRVPILMDGGIRRGTDIVKALALGAQAVMVGRPYLYGLAVDGAAGVQRVLEILRTELEMAMALAGKPTIASLDWSVLWQRPR